MCLPVATLAILENVPQGKKKVFIPANRHDILRKLSATPRRDNL